MCARMATPTVPFRAYITKAQHVFLPQAACCSVAITFQSCSVGPFTDAIVPNPCTMSTTADHDDVQSGLPAATDHSSDLASISDRLAPLSGHCPQSPPRQLRRHHRSPLRQPSKVGLAAAPIFSLAYLYTAAQMARTDSPMQPGLPDPVYDYACSSTAVSAAAVAAATCWPNNQYAPIIHKPVLQIYGPHIGYCSPITSKGTTHWLCYAFLP